MSIARFSVNNSVLVNMMMVVILIGGSMFACTLVREFFPESRPNKLSITAVHPGVQPQEIEKAVTIKVEEAVRDVEGIEKVDSIVYEGFTTTTLTLLHNVEDVNVVLQEVKNEVDTIQDLPDELEKITVTKLEPKLPVISVSIFGEGNEAALKRAALSVHDDLLLLPGVSDVQLFGTREDEISVEIRPERLLEYGITFDEVAQVIRRSNLDVSGGQLKGDRSNVAIRTLGEKERGVDLENIVIRQEPDGRKILVSDVATIRDDFVDTDIEGYFNAQPAVSCIVFKTESQDAIQISKLVKAYVYGKKNAPFDPFGFDAAFKKPWYARPYGLTASGISWLIGQVSGRPDPMKYYEESRLSPFDHDFQVALHTDLARFIEGRLDLLTRNGKTGLILVLTSLLLFLNWRVALWAGIGLLVSFLGTFVVMWALGATINLLSMFGLIIVLGIIVDDAIVIGENIYRQVEEGIHPREAAIRGAEEVMRPVTIAVLTTIAAFAPLLFIRGQIGDFMRVLPIVVTAALAVSLLEALLILPAHLSHLPAKQEREAREQQQTNNLALMAIRFRLLQERFVHSSLLVVYERFLRFVLRWRYVTIAVSVCAFVTSIGLLVGLTPNGPVLGNIVRSEFIQKMDSETLICNLEMSVGTTVENLKKRVLLLSKRAVEEPEVSNAQTYVALQLNLTNEGAETPLMQSHVGQIIIELLPADEREIQGMRSSEQMINRFRQVSAELSGVNSVTWEAMHGGPGGKDIVIKITGKDFDEVAEQVAPQIKQKLAEYHAVFDLDDNHERGKREIQIRVRQSAPKGIDEFVLGHHVRAAMYGSESRRLTRNREDVRIMVRYPEGLRKNVYNLESMWIPINRRGTTRGWVSLKQVAALTETEGLTSINRSQQARSVTVYGEVNDEVVDTAEVLNGIRTVFEKEIRPAHPDVRIEFLGSFEERTKAFGSLKIAFPIALLLIYMLLAGLFRSYSQPLVVMAAIPFGLQGAILGHWITDNPMTILSWIGMVALTGILVNDSLVLVDFVNKRIERGLSHFEATVQGAKLRLRAILLTTLTTVAGLTPLMFETSLQAKFLIPMAVTLTFGLVFATALTLVIVPTLNLIFFDIKKLLAHPGTPAREFPNDFSDECSKKTQRFH